ncbi:copper resistance protein CopC [Nocardioides sp. NPDC057767]|uniref:CopC domain-containing protein n=2 Tax=Nocardioides albertanoniae TaxID=1175486 RepID=A0A543A3S8_9ACTN|nr:copper resistance CopC family protein [Nocardioides sp. NBC_00368]TQL67214.1 hypothetical protein FB381_1087 [Nocardioides albertanoniae]
MPHPTRPRHLATLVAAAMVGAVALLGSVAPAEAHTAVVASNPAAGAQLSAMPTQVRLTFNEAISAEYATLTLSAPETPATSLSSPTAEGTQLVAAVPATATSGAGGDAVPWTLSFRVVSTDGHPVTGTVKFTVAARPATNPGDASPSASPTASASMTDEPRPSSGNRSSGTDAAKEAPGTTAGRIVFLAVLLVPLIAMPVVLLRRRKDGQE